MNNLGHPDDVPIGDTLHRTCIGCGNTFLWTSRPGAQWPGEYCSKPCRRRTRRHNRVERRVQLDDPTQVPATNGLRLLICARCGRFFGWTPPDVADWESLPAAPAYHSNSCRDKAKEERKKGRWQARQAARVARIAAAEDERRRLEEAEHAARVAEASAAARALLMPATHCQACGKVASPTKDDAKRAKREIEARTGRRNDVRYYQCPDGWWHWTRMDASLDGWRARQEVSA